VQRFLATFAALLAVSSAFAKSKPVKATFVSPCECKDQHGVDRWTPKTDLAPPPPFGIGIVTVTPSQIYQWRGPGPNVPLTRKTETRLPTEQKWYKLRGRVVDIRVEADGDIHVMLRDATGNKTGTVGVEIPVGTKWCKSRRIVFGWTTAEFPFAIKSNRVFTKFEPHVITVVGKAFYDVDHAPRDHSNHSTIHEKTAAWEIHPVMGLHVEQ
jgi:hypothetical protein